MFYLDTVNNCYNPEFLPVEFDGDTNVAPKVNVADIKVFPQFTNSTPVDVPKLDFSLINNIVFNWFNNMCANFATMLPTPMMTFENKFLEGFTPKSENRNQHFFSPEKTFDKFMEFVFVDEGGFNDDPKDPGGATNMGIRKDLYEKIMGPISLDDFKNLTKEQAKEYYYKNYWISSGANKLVEEGNETLAYALFDSAIHHGPETAKKMLKIVDGDVDKYMDERLEYLKGCKVWKTHKKGLTARIEKVEDRISKMEYTA